MEDEVRFALSRLRRGRFLVEQQKSRVARLAERGSPTATSVKLLGLMEMAVAGFEHYLHLHGWPGDESEHHADV
jgi:hypothetical protein